MPDNAPHINYTAADIQRYLHGGMTAKEMHEMERAALKDPFLADAIEGYRNSSFEQTNKHLNEINAALQADKEDAKVVSMPAKSFGWWKVAASIIGVVGIATISFLVLNKADDKQAVAKNEEVSTTKLDTAENLKESAALVLDSTLLQKEGKKLIAATREKQFQKKLSKAKANRDLNKNSEAATAAAFANAETLSDTAPVTVEGYAAVKPSSAAPMLRGRASGIAVTKNYKGKVVDVNNEPVPNAAITVNDKTVITDLNGSFDIATHDTAVKANISALGFSSVEKPLKTDTLNMIILNGADNALADVVVTELNFKNKEHSETDTVNVSAPVGGWPSFQEYVYKKLNKYYDSSHSSGTATGQMVDVEFSINDDGSPYNFKVNQSPGNGVSAEAIDAIKRGPKWIPGKRQKKARVQLNLH